MKWLLWQLRRDWEPGGTYPVRGTALFVCTDIAIFTFHVATTTSASASEGGQALLMGRMECPPDAERNAVVAGCNGDDEGRDNFRGVHLIRKLRIRWTPYIFDFMVKWQCLLNINWGRPAVLKDSDTSDGGVMCWLCIPSGLINDAFRGALPHPCIGGPVVVRVTARGLCSRMCPAFHSDAGCSQRRHYEYQLWFFLGMEMPQWMGSMMSRYRHQIVQCGVVFITTNTRPLVVRSCLHRMMFSYSDKEFLCWSYYVIPADLLVLSSSCVLDHDVRNVNGVGDCRVAVVMLSHPQTKITHSVERYPADSPWWEDHLLLLWWIYQVPRSDVVFTMRCMNVHYLDYIKYSCINSRACNKYVEYALPGSCSTIWVAIYFYKKEC